MPSGHLDQRVAWVDYAKGLCIIFVVMMHSTFGVEALFGREGWMHHVVAFAKPFRMPDFFLLSGLFLARVIGRDWRTYLDRKVVHFAYFYVLWVTIQFAFKAPGLATELGWAGVLGSYLHAYVEPFGTLWFIYLLPIFFVFTKLTRAVPPILVWAVAAVLEALPIETGWTVIDEFANRFVYFYSGYILAPLIFSFADRVALRPRPAIVGLLLWAALNQVAVWRGIADWPVASLALGFLGASAIVAVSSLMARSDGFGALRYCGENSIVIYLAFFLPMAASRAVLVKTGLVTDVGTVALLVTTAGIVGALVVFWAVRHTVLRLLFERPGAFRFDNGAAFRLRTAQ